MRKAVLAALALVTGIALAPGDADADGRRDRPRLHSSPPTRFFPRDHFHGHRRFRGHNGGFTTIIAPPVITYSVPQYVPVPEYVPPPPMYAPPAYSYAPPPPMQRVVEFPTGRYELHGDGITTPYRWVWIPNPPASPPVEEPPAAPPAPASAEPTRRTAVYRWTDAAGVVHLTDRLEKVPEAYR